MKITKGNGQQFNINTNGKQFKLSKLSKERWIMIENGNNPMKDQYFYEYDDAIQFLKDKTEDEEGKAKIGDTIKSFDFEGKTGGFYIGIVTNVKIDKNDGCEYVYFISTTRVNKTVNELKDIKAIKKELRIVQNGHPKIFGDKTDFIDIIKGE